MQQNINPNKIKNQGHKPQQTAKKSGTKPQKKSANTVENLINKPVKSIQELTGEQLTNIGYVLAWTYIVLLTYRYIKAIWFVEPMVMSNNPIFITLCVGLLFALWVYSTKYDRYHFHNKKKRNLYIFTATSLATVIQPLVTISNNTIVKKVMGLPTGEHVSEGMILLLARIGIIVPLVIACIIIGGPIKEFLTATEMSEKIDAFRITHHIDTRKNKENLYDLNIMKDLKTGKDRIIKHGDRFVHMFINGASGTGKTSSTITRAIECDLDKKVINREKREAALLEMVKARECVVVGPVRNITERNVKPRKQFLDKYRKIYETYPDCGMTIMAPNNSLNDDVVKLCEARKINVNVIDPAKKYTEKCVRRLGINPFYIKLGLSERERAIAITDAASNFSEVIVATNETQAATDIYFRDINTSVTTNVAIACMLANNINQKQTIITEIQQCIGEFKNLEPYVKTIEDYFNIEVKASEIKSKGAKDASVDLLNRNRTNSDRSHGRDNPYYDTIKFIKQELLGPGAEKLYDQARGLRNLINKLLQDPRVRELLCMPTDQSVNFAEILRNNEITVVNTAIEFNAQSSTAFGLFFMLNHAVEVKKRKKEERSPHFVWIDEASQYMHRMYDDMIALYRQYGVAVGLAMQSVSQMMKSSTTAYLKDVILGCGTQIVFGRVSAEEMKLYSELAGIEKIDLVQKQGTKTSLFSKNASESFGERTTPDQQNVQEGSQIRMRDFQEVTVFTINEGRVLHGFAAKLRFVKKEAFNPRRITLVNWSKYLLKKEKERTLTKPAQEIVKEQEDILRERTGNMNITEKYIQEPLVKIELENTTSEESLLSANIFEDDISMDILGADESDYQVDTSSNELFNANVFDAIETKEENEDD